MFRISWRRKLSFRLLSFLVWCVSGHSHGSGTSGYVGKLSDVGKITQSWHPQMHRTQKDLWSCSQSTFSHPMHTFLYWAMDYWYHWTYDRSTVCTVVVKNAGNLEEKSLRLRSTAKVQEWQRKKNFIFDIFCMRGLDVHVYSLSIPNYNACLNFPVWWGPGFW